MQAIEAGRTRSTKWPLRTDSWALVGPGLRRSYREGRQAMRRVAAEPDAENVHEWRKRAKDLWYQLRIVRDAWPELLGATVDQAHELDRPASATTMTWRCWPRICQPPRARRPRRLRDRDRAAPGRASRRGASSSAQRLYAEKPKAFRRRISAYWLAWREA